MPNKISISNDIALPLIQPLACLHEHLGPPPPPPAPPVYVKLAVAAEIPVPMFWPPGFALGQNKLTTTVLHKGLPIVQDGHDCGALIIHVQIVPSPLNIFTLPLHIPFSGRKANFSASKVQSQGKPTACCTLTSLPPAPMTPCWDPVSPPLGGAPTSHLNTVVITMSWADIILGWAAVAAAMALDWLLDKYGGPDPKGWGDIGMKVLGKFFPVSRTGLRDWAAKQALGVLTGAARLAFTDGPADVKIGIGAPFFQGEVGISRDASGNYSGVAGVRSANRSGEATYDEGQVSTKREQGGLGGPAGGTDSQSTDAAGNRTDSSSTPSWNPTHWGAPL